jgi:hypothetical protein
MDLKEGHLLALRLKIELEAHGIELDADRFQQVLEDDNDIAQILKFCGKVLYPESQKKGQTEDLESLALSYEDSSCSEDDDFAVLGDTAPVRKPTSFAGFCRMLEEDLRVECNDVKMTKEDKLSMICLSKKYTSGSVAAARGMSMT